MDQSKLVHGTGATSVAALKVAQINCVEDWTVPDHSVICDVHTKRIGLVCVGGVNVALHSVFPQKVHFFSPSFSVFIHFIIIGPAGRFHTRLLPPAACRQPKIKRCKCK